MKQTLNESRQEELTEQRKAEVRQNIAAMHSDIDAWKRLKHSCSENNPNDNQFWWQPDNFRAKLERIEDRIAQEDYLTNINEAEEMISADNNFRFRMAAVALGFDPYLLSSDSNTQQQGPTILTAGGVTYAFFDKNIVLLLPDIENSDQNEKVMQDLLEIFDSPKGRCSNWIIDFSAMTHKPSIMLIGVLKGYLDELGKNGATVSLAWLKPSLLKGSLLELTKRAFNLKNIGGYLFFQDYQF